MRDGQGNVTKQGSRMIDRLSNVRQSDRYAVTGSLRFSLCLAWSEEGKQRAVPGQIIDISETGCHLQTTGILPRQNQTILVRLESTAAAVLIEVSARVCWSRQVNVGKFACGLRFRRPLPPSVMMTLLDRGLASRRESDRFQIWVPVTIHRQLDQSPNLEGHLCDFSPGGVQLVTDAAIEVDARIMISTEAKEKAILRVVWSRREEQTFRCGAAFLHRSTLSLMNKSL